MLDFARVWPPDSYLWLWKTVGAEGNSAGWDVAREEDAQHSPEARLLLRKLRYTVAIVQAIGAVHDSLQEMLLASKAVECCTNNWTHSQGLQVPPRVVVQVHWGRKKEY